MMTQKKYYGKYLNDAKRFSEEIYDAMTENGIDLGNKTHNQFIFIDKNNKEWKINVDYPLGVLELNVSCKTMVDGSPVYKFGWGFDINNKKCEPYHLIQVENIYFHIDRTDSLLTS